MRRSLPSLAVVTVLLLVACLRPAALHSGGLSGGGRVERLYRVAFGDTLSGIASSWAVPGGYVALARQNHVADPNLIFEGDKLRITSSDPALPEVPRTLPAPAMEACPMQPVASRPTSLSGCVAASCVDTGRGGRACACQGAAAAGDALLVLRPGAPAERLALRTETPWWYDASTAPEPERSPRTLLGVHVQLDADAPLETLVAWRTQLGDLGMAHGTALVVDDDGRPGALFPADNFGVGSAVRAGDHCDVLATEWALTDQPGWRSAGWYLEGRRYGVGGGALVPGATALTMRRLFQNFHPATTAVGGLRMGAPAVDLTEKRAFARTTDPAVEYTAYGVQSGTIRAARREDGKLVVDLDGRVEPVDPDAGTLRRVGDAATGLLYPTGYAPADDTTLRGHPYELRGYLTEWGESWQVLWVR